MQEGPEEDRNSRAVCVAKEAGYWALEHRTVSAFSFEEVGRRKDMEMEMEMGRDGGREV